MRPSTSLWLILLSAPLLSLQANAQAFKCKSATGETLFSSSPCSGTDKTVTVVQPEYIPPEEQARAAERQAKRESQLQDIKTQQTQKAASGANSGTNSGTTASNNTSQSEAICREAVETMSQNPGLLDSEKIRLKQNCLTQSYCLQAATPTPGSITGLSAEQKRTLQTCASEQGGTYSEPIYVAPPPNYRPRPPYDHTTKPPKDPSTKPPAESKPEGVVVKPGRSLPQNSIRLPGTLSE